MNILVTGGAGYIGSVLVPMLLECGEHVTVLDNFMYRQNSLALSCADKNFEVVNGDCRDPRNVIPLLRKADVIIPLAAIVGAPACERDIFTANNTNYEAVNMICQEAHPQQSIIYPNSNSGYGIGEQGALCTEESPLKPISLYGREKCAAERVVLDRKNSIAFRLATVFGASPRMRADLIVNDFVYRAVSDRSIVVFEGKFRRNFVHVRDVCSAFIHALENFQAMRGDCFNCGDTRANMSKIELCETIKRHIPSLFYCEANIGEDNDKRDYIVSNEKLEKTGWKPSFSLDDGIKELVKLYSTISVKQYTNV